MTDFCSCCEVIFNESDNVFSTPCGHIFHQDCLFNATFVLSNENKYKTRFVIQSYRNQLSTAFIFAEAIVRFAVRHVPHTILSACTAISRYVPKKKQPSMILNNNYPRKGCRYNVPSIEIKTTQMNCNF